MVTISTAIDSAARFIAQRMRFFLLAVSLPALFLWSGARVGAATPIAEILNPSGVTAINVALLTPLVYTINGRALNTGQVTVTITKEGDVTPAVDTDVDVVAGAWQYPWEYPSGGGSFTIVATPTAPGGTADSITIALNAPLDPNPHESLDLMLNAGAVYANSTALNVQLRIAGGSTAINTVAWGGDIGAVAATSITTTNYNDNNAGTGLRYQATASGGDGAKTAIASVEFNWAPPETVSSRRSIILDMTKPTTTITAATENDYITQPDDPDNTAIIQLSGTVTDTYGPRSVEIQLFTTPGTPVAQPLTPAEIEYGNSFGGTLNWTARVSVPNTTTEAHNFRVIATDYAGNVNEDPTYYAIPIYSDLALGKPFIVGKEGVSDSPVPVYVTGTQTVRSVVTNPAKYKNNTAKFYVNSNDENASKEVITGVTYLAKNNKNFSFMSGEKTLKFRAKDDGTETYVYSEELNIFTGGIGVSSLLIDNIVPKAGVKYVAGIAALKANCSTGYFESYIKTLNLRDELVANGSVTNTSIKNLVSYTLTGGTLVLTYAWNTAALTPGLHKLRITGADIDDEDIDSSNEYTVYVANADLSLENIVVTGNVSSSTPPRVKDTVTVKSQVTEAYGNNFLIPIVINSKLLLGTEASPADPEATLQESGGIYHLTYDWDTTNAADNTTYNLQYKITDIFGGERYSASSAVIVDNTSTALTITTNDIDGLNPASGVFRNYPGDLNSIYVKGQIRIPGTGTNYDMIKLETIGGVEDRYIFFNTDPAVDPTDYTMTKMVAANTANITVDLDTALTADGEYEIWLSATDINDAPIPSNHEILTVDNTPPVININDPSSATPQIKFDPPTDNTLTVKALIDEANPLDWTVDIAYYLSGDTDMKHDIYQWSERSKDGGPGRTNSTRIDLVSVESSVSNVSVIWTIPDDWDTATAGTILVSAIDKAENEAPTPPVPQVTFTFALPGDTTVAPIAALAVNLADGADPSAKFVIAKNNGEPAAYETIGNPQTGGMGASSGDPSEGFTRPNGFYPDTDYNNPLTPTLEYDPKRVYTNSDFVVDAAARISPKDTLALMQAYPDTFSLTISSRLYNAGQNKVEQNIVEFILKNLAVTTWDKSVTRTLSSVQIGGVECPTLYTLTNVANKVYYGSNQTMLEVLIDKTSPAFRIMAPSSVYCARAYTDDTHTTSQPMSPAQRYIVIPPGGTVPVVFKLNKDVPDDYLRMPLKRAEVGSGVATVYKQMPELMMTLHDAVTGAPIKYKGEDVVYSLVRATESPNPYNGDGRALVTGNNFDRDGYTVAWNIPIDKKFAVGRTYRLRLQGMSDIVGNKAITDIAAQSVDAIDIFFKVSLRR